MADLNLRKLPDRTPVKIAISIMPELFEQLTAYAEVYEATYGARERVADLIPFMLAMFIESDRTFVKHRRTGKSRRD